MTHFPFSEPSIEEPEVVHQAYRQARRAWGREREAVTMLHAGDKLSPDTRRALQDDLSYAEVAMLDAAKLYLIALREAHPALREAQAV